MDFNLQKIVGIEWHAQRIVLEKPNIGPQIFIVNTILDEAFNENDAVLIMQGSYDPPTLSHIELIKRAIRRARELFKNKQLYLLLLLSLSHVEKSMELTRRTILSSRVEMLELVLSEVEFGVPVSIGLSNVARYLDLIKAVKNINDFSKIAFILGMDVFGKIFNQKYYNEPLKEVLPEIFEVDYFVAGRENIQSVEQFVKVTEENLGPHRSLIKKIHYLTLPKNVRQISSTRLRNELYQKATLNENLLIEGVQDYVTKHRLYTSEYSWVKKQTLIYEGVKKALEEKQTYQKALEFVQFLFREDINDERMLTDWKKHINRRWDQFQQQIT
ncbi:MAG: hypothetical protein ACTSW1_17600 [Candidatus Hodarchaeales archaeon]